MILVTAYGQNDVILFEARPLGDVKGMSWGVREDAITGRRLGLVGNQCTCTDSQQVYYWNIVKVD